MILVDLFLSCLLITVTSANELDVNSQSELIAAITQAVQHLPKYLSSTPLPQSPQGWTWQPVAMDTVFRFALITRDETDVRGLASLYSQISSKHSNMYLNMTYAGTEWNQRPWSEELVRWASVALTGAEKFGPNVTLENGLQYSNIALVALKEAFQDWDASGCETGGFLGNALSPPPYVFGGRKPTPNPAETQKRTITHAEFITQTARASVSLKNPKLADRAEAIYQWLWSVGLVSTGRVYHFIADVPCSNGSWTSSSSNLSNLVDTRELIHNYGGMIAASSALYQATSNPKYLEDAKGFLNRFSSLFVKDGVLLDSCGPGECPLEGVIARPPAETNSTSSSASRSASVTTMVTQPTTTTAAAVSVRPSAAAGSAPTPSAAPSGTVPPPSAPVLNSKTCSPSNCRLGEGGSWYKVDAIRGLTRLWGVSSDPAIKTTIETIILNSLKAMVPTCVPNWMCDSNWDRKNGVNQGPFEQVVSVELLNAAALIKGLELPPSRNYASQVSSGYLLISYGALIFLQLLI